MTHSYKIKGMTCSSCQAKVEGALVRVKGVNKVTTDLKKEEVVIEMQQHIAISDFKDALKEYPRYELSEKEIIKNKVPNALPEEEQKSWLETYKPILLLFAFITGVTVIAQIKNESFNWMQWMNHFMAGFFLVFSFFKLLNLNGFAESYAMYDVVAKRIKVWAYIYVFIELGLGIAYLTGFNPVATNLATVMVMSVSIIGVLQSVLDNKKIKCACLGDVFNLPMSTITIIEDALMIGMSGTMLVYLF